MSIIPHYLYQLHADTKPLSVVANTREEAREFKRSHERLFPTTKFRIIRYPVIKSAAIHIR